MLDGMTEEEWIRKNNQESDVRKFVRENPTKTIKDLLEYVFLKAVIRKEDINFEENYIKVRFGEDEFMSLRFNFEDVNEENVDRLIRSLLDYKCEMIGGI